MNMKEKLQSLVQNSIVLDISEELEKYEACSTHFGGQPDVPADFQWPRYQGKGYNYECEERPLTFLAQFNCAEFTALDARHILPDHGLLSFFYEMDSQPWGFAPEHKGGLKVYWFEDLSTLSRAEFPEDMEEDFQFPAINIKAHTDLSYPGWSDFIQKFPEEDDDEAFESVQKELNIEEPEECSKLLGWADVIQDSMYEECDLVTKGYYLGNPEGYAKITPDDRQAAETAMDRWQLLFQLDMVETDDFELMFGDCGRLYVFIKKEDLINLYQFAQRHESEIGNEILNNSNMKVVIPFTTITITLILSQIAEAFKISNFAVNKSGGTDFWISILILAIMGYFLFTLVVFIFEKIEKKLFLDILMSQKKKMNNFLRYLEEVILNYDLYYDLNKSEMIDDNYENCSKIKRKLINKIKFLIR